MIRPWLSIGALTAGLVLNSVPLKAQPVPLGNNPTPILKSGNNSRVIFDTYILGPGDRLEIELLDLPKLSGRVSIGPDGTIYLPRLRALYVEGLNIEELRLFLTEQFRPYVLNPEIYIRPISYRPIRVYIGGEVKRPGYYRISGVQGLAEELSDTQSSQLVGPQAPLGSLVGTDRWPIIYATSTASRIRSSPYAHH